MAVTEKNIPKKSKWQKAIGILFLIIVLLIGGKYYMDRKKVDDLYRHGFSLLEEQIATYIVEHYAGVSKVEFSPILFRKSMGEYSSAEIVPVIYDHYGNKAYLSHKIGSVTPSRYGLGSGLSAVDFDSEGHEIIYIETDTDEIDVSQATKLPEEAKFTSSSIEIDYNIGYLLEDGQLKGVEKSEKGSPDATIVYNIEMKDGEYWKWKK